MDVRARGTPGEVLARFFRLGLVSFGGPVAHIGYFRTEFVERAGWLDDATFSEAVALCSVLPGPTSSQVGILIGALRAGPAGGLCAWLGFTTPSAVVLAVFGVALHAALYGPTAGGSLPAAVAGAFAGLAAAAGGVVAAAVLALARSLCTTAATGAIAVAALAVALVAPRLGSQLQWVPLVLGAAAGALLLHREARLPAEALPLRVPRVAAIAAAIALAAGLVVLPAPAAPQSAAALAATFFRAGSLVFGGGHVVLPFLQGMIGPAEVPAQTFLAGYGVAQVVPGPLFTFASFLGAANGTPVHGVFGALVATIAIFLPSFLLLAAVLPVWGVLRALPRATAALAGVNASVVGLLASVLVTPVGAGLVRKPLDAAIAVAAFVALARFRIAPWIVVGGCAAAGALAAALSQRAG